METIIYSVYLTVALAVVCVTIKLLEIIFKQLKNILKTSDEKGD